MTEEQVKEFKREVRVFLQDHEEDRKKIIMIKGILRKIDGFDWRTQIDLKQLNQSNDSDTDREEKKNSKIDMLPQDNRKDSP